MKINFSSNLETIRKSKKISQEELAELIGVSRQTIYKWEADICLPNLNKIEKILKEHNLSKQRGNNQNSPKANTNFNPLLKIPYRENSRPRWLYQ